MDEISRITEGPVEGHAGAMVGDGRSGDEGHGLAAGAVSLPQSIIFSVASSAPGQATAVTIAGLVAASAYAGGVAVLITTLPMLAIAFAYHRLNMWSRDCGGSYMWVGKAISPYVGFMVGWVMLTGYLLGTVADILPIGPAVLSFLGMAADGVIPSLITVAVAGLLVIATAVVGVQVTARFQVIIASVEYVILLAFCAIGIYKVYLVHAPGTMRPSWEWLSLNGVGGQGSLVAGMLITVYLFTGWDSALYLNEETERPESNPGRAAMMSVVILGLFYALLQFSLQGAAPAADLQEHGGDALTFLATSLVGEGWGKFMSVAVILSVLGTTQAFLVSAARIAFSMGTDRVLPPAFGKLHQRYRTPVFATVLFGVVMIVATWVYVLSSSIAGAFDVVVSITGVLFALFYSATGIATAVFYRKFAQQSAMNLLTTGVLPLAGAGALGWVAIRSIMDFDSQALWSVLAVAALGVVMLVVSAVKYRPEFFRMPREAYEPTDAL
ncbi:APC family permease [Phycicoccus sp.]|uniref:APC family permease n=1 Tax=Phycicoccus sp. TaxID=1902410 RepID=UPI002B79D729|nr:APC family permease [Phycicoccus sp.]HMM94041.1 APC family permease [Phycicoccus sp.]